MSYSLKSLVNGCTLEIGKSLNLLDKIFKHTTCRII